MGRMPIPKTAKNHYPFKRCSTLGKGLKGKKLHQHNKWACKCNKAREDGKNITKCACFGIGENAGRKRTVKIPAAYKKAYNKKYAAWIKRHRIGPCGIRRGTTAGPIKGPRVVLRTVKK